MTCDKCGWDVEQLERMAGADIPAPCHIDKPNTYSFRAGQHDGQCDIIKAVRACRPVEALPEALGVVTGLTLQEALWELVEKLNEHGKRHYREGDNYNQGWAAGAYCGADKLEHLLPPRPPKLVTGLTLQEALEGLRDGVYARARPEGGRFWMEWGEGDYLSEDGHDWALSDDDLGPWRAEVKR